MLYISRYTNDGGAVNDEYLRDFTNYYIDKYLDNQVNMKFKIVFLLNIPYLDTLIIGHKCCSTCMLMYAT